MNAGDLVLLTQASHDETSWRVRAACADTGTESFFTTTDEATHPRWQSADDVERAAVALCGGCPVRNDCLTHALRTPETHGIWGGTTPAERESILMGLAS